MTKIRRHGGYIRERLRDPVALRRRGWHFRTRVAGTHRVVLAFPPGARRGGAGVVQAILHPRGEAGGRGAKFACSGEVCRRIKEQDRIDYWREAAEEPTGLRTW